jgi:hypothetical protein
MHRGLASRWRLCLIVLAPFLAITAAVSAAELTLHPKLVSEEDLLRVVSRDDGEVGILRFGAVDRIAGDGAVTTRSRARSGETLFLADDGGTVGVVTYREGAADFAPTATFKLQDASGATLWSRGPSEDITYAISKTGVVVGMSLNINVPERNAFHIYDADGSQIAEIAAPHLLSGRFDPDGQVFFALSASQGLNAYDLLGTHLWTLPAARIFAAAPGGIEVAAVGEGYLHWVRAGEHVASADLEGLLVRRIAVAPDGSRIALAGKHELRVYGGADLRMLWSAVLESEQLAFTSVDPAANDGWLLAGVARDLGRGIAPEQRHPDGEVRAYDATGALRHSTHMEFPIWNIWTPRVVLDRSGKAATITTRRAVYRTVLP